MLDAQWTVTVFKLDKQINYAIKCFLFCFGVFYHLRLLYEIRPVLFINVFEHPLTQCVWRTVMGFMLALLTLPVITVSSKYHGLISPVLVSLHCLYVHF